MTKVTELVVGAILPPFIDIVNKRVKNSNIRYVISLVACLLVGFLLNYQSMNIADLLGSGAVIFASAQTVYKTYYAKSDIRKSLLKRL